MKQIEMRLVDRELAPAGHHESRSQERQVERLAVVRRAGAERLEIPFQVLDELAFRSDVAQEMLSQDELAITQVREPDEEHVRARASRKAGRLRVEEQHVLPQGGRV